MNVILPSSVDNDGRCCLYLSNEQVEQINVVVCVRVLRAPVERVCLSSVSVIHSPHTGNRKIIEYVPSHYLLHFFPLSSLLSNSASTCHLPSRTNFILFWFLSFYFIIPEDWKIRRH